MTVNRDLAGCRPPLRERCDLPIDGWRPDRHRCVLDDGHEGPCMPAPLLLRR